MEKDSTGSINNFNNMEGTVISARVRLARNLRDYPFPHRLNTKQSGEITEKVRAALEPVKNNFRFVSLAELDKPTRLSLAEENIISPQMVDDKNCSFFEAKDGKTEILINDEDHVRIQTIFGGDGLDRAYELADKFDDLLDESLNFAFSEKYGYLTACLTNTGTGLRASYMLHLPMLEKTKQIKGLQNEVGRFGMVIRGIYGEGSDPLGSLYQISNQLTLGRSEKEIINELKNTVSMIIKKEKQLQERILNNNDYRDMVYRSLGLLKYCKKISGLEAMEHLSNIKLGISSGIIKDKKDNIYSIMKDIQSGSLCKRAGEILDAEERDILRAKFLNDNL